MGDTSGKGLGGGGTITTALGGGLGPITKSGIKPDLKLALKTRGLLVISTLHTSHHLGMGYKGRAGHKGQPLFF